MPVAAFDSQGKAVRIIFGFQNTNEPSVYVMAVYAAGPGFSIQGAVGAAVEPDGILDCSDRSLRAAESVLIKISEQNDLF